MGNTMNATDLHRVLHNAVLFAAKGDNLPMIEAVRLEFSTDKVIAVATDRFVLGASRADYSGEEFTALISRGDADRLAKLAKTVGKPVHRDAVRTVDIEHVSDDTPASLTFRFSTGEAMTVSAVNHEFPKFRQLMPTEQAQHIAGHVSVNPTYLAKFTKVIDGDRASRMMISLNTPTRPASVSVGKDFVGIIMPVRSPEGSVWALPEWL